MTDSEKLLVRLKPDISRFKAPGFPMMEPGKVYQVTYQEYERLRDGCEIVPTAWRAVSKTVLDIWVPDSLTAVYLVLTKLHSLLKKCNATSSIVTAQEYIGRPRRAGSFLKGFPGIMRLRYRIGLGYGVPPNSGFLIDYDGFDYVFDPRPVLYAGTSLEDWLPELETDYNIANAIRMAEPKSTEYKSLYVLMRNEEFASTHQNIWTPRHWARLLQQLSKYFNLKLVGLDCDRDFAESVLKYGVKIKANLIGTTPFKRLIGMIVKSGGLLSVRSGVALAAAGAGARTCILWFPGSGIDQRFHTSWIKKTKFYQPIVVNETYDGVINQIKRFFGVA